MNRRQLLSLIPVGLFGCSLSAAEPLRLEDAVRSSFGRSSNVKVYAELAISTDRSHKMYWTVDRTQMQRTIDCFKEWADLVLRNRMGKGFVLTVGEDHYSVDKNLFCTPMEK